MPVYINGVEAFVNINVGGTWSVPSGTWTIPAVTLGGTVTVGSQIFDAGAYIADIRSTMGFGPLWLRVTRDDANGARLTQEQVSASPALGDHVGGFGFAGRDSAGNQHYYGVFDVDIVDPTNGAEHGKGVWYGYPHNVETNIMELSDEGLLLPKMGLLEWGNRLAVPTNAGWTETLVGSGATFQLPTYNRLDTGATNSSSALLYCLLAGFNLGSTDWDRINWDKKLVITFNYSPSTSVASAVRRVQVKSVATEGALGAKGIGLRVDNLALFGESYGTGLAALDLATTLTSTWLYQIMIVHEPAHGKIEWWVDGVLKGTQSTANNIPSGISAAAYFVHSIIKGAVADLAFSFLFQPRLVQEH